MRHSSIASWTFFPTNASSFITVLEQTHLFPFYEKKKGERKAEQAMIVGSLRMIHLRVWVWVWVDVRVSGWDVKWFYDDEPISITRATIRWHEEDLHMIWKDSVKLLKDQIWVPKNLTQYKPSIWVRLRAESSVLLLLETKSVIIWVLPLDVVVANLILVGTSMIQLEKQQNSLWQRTAFLLLMRIVLGTA